MNSVVGILASSSIIRQRGFERLRFIKSVGANSVIKHFCAISIQQRSNKVWECTRTS